MAKPELRVVTRASATLVARNLIAKEFALVKDLLDAEGFEELDRSCRAFLDYWEPRRRLMSVTVARDQDGRGDGHG